jgi:hypothetical protein
MATAKPRASAAINFFVIPAISCRGRARAGTPARYCRAEDEQKPNELLAAPKIAAPSP